MMKHLILSVLVALLVGCSTIPVDERPRFRAEVSYRAADTIESLTENEPEIRSLIDESEGYFVGRLTGAKIPVLGGATGMGVLYDNADSTRTFMNIDRFDFGVGVGAGKYRVLAVFTDREVLERFKKGAWKTAIGADTGAGAKGGASATGRRGMEVFFLGETGAMISTTARLVRLSVNTDLTDNGLSAVSIPGTGFRANDSQGEDAPRTWNHKLPFLAQKVIDLGYDLPLPYGIGVTYANVDQDMELDNLWVGINGSEEEPFEFVSFENANAQSESVQLKLDAWLFPFMNVFAMAGKVEGDAPLDVILDGNGMLDQIGADCSGFPPSPLCSLLQDKTLLLPITAAFSGNTYGLGTVLAGGWKGWFVALPINITYADMDTTDTEGVAITATPRFGRVINLNRWGNLALFAGGNYLKTELTITGQVSTPDELLIIDYTIDQRNADRWNLLLGANWDLSKHWSWSVEYNGFIGSREAFITSISWSW